MKARNGRAELSFAIQLQVADVMKDSDEGTADPVVEVFCRVHVDNAASELGLGLDHRIVLIEASTG